MNTIYEYKVRVITESGILYKVGNVFDLKEIQILKENDDYLCLDNKEFSTLSKSKAKSYAYPSVNIPVITHSINDDCWGTGVRYSIYTRKAIRNSTIKKQIEKYINQKFGSFISIDLSFLVKPERV